MSELKYAPGRGPRRTSSGRPISIIEKVIIGHLAIYTTLASWYFGGCSDSARTALSWWGTVGALILVVILGDKTFRREANLRALRWLWPFVAFNVVVLLSCLIPSFRELSFGDDTGYIKIDGISRWLPSTALPVESLKGLWLFDATYLSAFLLLVSVSQRRSLRWLLAFAGTNAIALAIFGTLQKLTHATGLFFGAVHSPQPSFFASFIYDNHWGAFVVLMSASLLGIAIRALRRQSTHEFLHSPFLLGLIGLVLLAISVPLSNSRACTLLMTVLFAFAIASWMFTSIRRRRQLKESTLLPVLAAAGAVLVVSAAVWFVASESITSRLEKTKAQYAEMQASKAPSGRSVLYHDTWRMASDMPVFGWGMNSYPHVFMLYNTAESKADDLPVFFHDAHSDWLQSVAEHGFVGTILLVLCTVLPLSKLRGIRSPGPLPSYLLFGCLLVLLYATVEFPFGNPAVVLAWLVCAFCAVRYTLLESTSSKKSY